MTVLIVEDHKPFSRAIRQGLEEEGYTVHVAGSCEEADALARASRYATIIVDLVRFREKGCALLQRWRQGGLIAPVLVLTAPGSTEEGIGCLRVGADDWLTLPFRLEDLLSRVRALCGPAGPTLGLPPGGAAD
jgi:two-component system OmpR family response regulator